MGPACRANRKGSVEKSNHFIAQRWRTADMITACALYSTDANRHVR